MIKIGDFARLSQVSVVTLRYYKEIGFSPEQIKLMLTNGLSTEQLRS